MSKLDNNPGANSLERIYHWEGWMKMDIPFWMYLVVMGIVFSAFMVYKTGKEERQMEDEIIEREGEVYMQRLEQEREEKRTTEKSMGV